MSHLDGTDNCSCYKMRGEWGQGGFHWRIMGLAECFRRMEAYGQIPEEGPPRCIRGLVEKECVAQGGCTYQGQQSAIGHCHEWLRKTRKAMAEKKAQRAADQGDKLHA